MRIKSITWKLSIVLMILVSTISAIIGVWSIKNTNKIIEEEMGKMNNKVLHEVANNISILLSNVEEIGNNIIDDNKLIQILSIPKDDILKGDENIISGGSYIEGLLNEQVWKYGKYNMKPELYVVCENGLNFSTYSKFKYDINQIKNEYWYKQIVEAEGNTVLISTVEDKDGIGPYKSIFKMGRLIKDLITDETLGILIMDVSEKMLYDRYNSLVEDGRDIYIIDAEGKVISNKDKRLIGKNYNSTIDNDKYLERKDGYSIFVRDGLEYMKITSELDKYGWNIVEELPLDIVKGPINEIKQTFLVTIILVLLMFFIVIYIISAWITKPVITIKNTMKKVIKGDLKAEVIVDRYDEIGQLQESFNEMVSWLDKSMDEIKEKERQKRFAELSFLQAQVNPHFLYNTLSGIRFLISMNKNEEAEEMIFRFTKLLRSILPKASEFISLEEEINTIKDYIELQKIRYPNAFNVKINLKDEVKEYKLPCLILQPIVENAIFYSMENESKKGEISIIAYKDNNNIKIEICDNGKGISRDKLENMFNNKESINRVGLINVHERIVLNYGNEYGLKIESEETMGTRVIFVLPS